MNGILQFFDIESKAQEVIRVIDKIDKIGQEEVKNELNKLGLEKEKIKSLINFLTADATNVRLYIDGQLVASKGSALSLTSGGTDTRLGRQFDTSSEFFHGKIDELWIYSGALTAVEVAALASTVTWNPTVDFSTSNGNPNRVWTYGWMNNAFTTFTPYVTHGSNNWYGWGGDQSPAVWLNTGASTSYGVPPGSLAIHPGNGNEPSVLRWTAPVTAVVRVSGQFLAGDFGTMQVAVRHNNSVLWTATDAGAFDLTVNVSIGDTLNFAVFGAYFGGSTPLQLSIAVGTVSLPLTTGASNKISLGTFPAGTRIQISVTGTGDLANSNLQTNPDGSLAAVAGSPWGAANVGAVYPTVGGFLWMGSAFRGRWDGYDLGGSGWMFAGVQTTDDESRRDSRGRGGRHVCAGPTRSVWFAIGYGGTFTVPAGD